MVGVLYISAHIRGEELNGKGDQLKDLVLEAQQREMEVVVMGILMPILTIKKLRWIPGPA